MPYNPNIALTAEESHNLIIEGDYTHKANAIFMIRANAQGKSDMLSVLGNVKLEGGTVSVLASDSDCYAQNTRYTILRTGIIEGKFDKVETDLAFLDPHLEYDQGFCGAYVYLFLTRNGKSHSAVASTENQKTVAGIIDQAERQRNGLTGIVQYINDLSAEGARKAYDQISGPVHRITTPVSSYTANKHMAVLQSRTDSFLYGGTIPASLAMAIDNGASYADAAVGIGSAILQGLAINGGPSPRDGLYSYTLGFGGTGDIAQSANIRTSGLLIGHDKKLGPSSFVGYVVGYYDTDGSPNGFESTINSKGYHISAYGAHKFDNFYLSGIMDHTYNTYDIKRIVKFSTLYDERITNYDGKSLYGDIEMGYIALGESIDVIPFCKIHRSYIEKNGFSEPKQDSNDGLILASDKYTSSSLRFNGGVKVRKSLSFNKWNITPELSLIWDQSLLANENNGRGVYLADVPNTKIGSPSKVQSMAIMSGGLVVKWADNLSLYLDYKKSFASDMDTNEIKMQMGYSW